MDEAEQAQAPRAAPSSPPASPPTPKRGRRRARWRWSGLLTFSVGLIGVAAIWASAYTLSETRRETLRLSGELAQLRLAMELSARQPQGDQDVALEELEERLAALEEATHAQPAPATAVPATVPEGNAAATSDDCLPTGTRFLVSAGDRWPVCGTGTVVEVASVEPGYMTLLDGSVVAAGGNFPLVGGRCLLAVISAGTAELSSYAEIRVTC